MEFFVKSSICFIVALFPLLACTVYVIYTRSLDKSDIHLCTDLMITGILYLLMLFSPRDSLLIASIPLLYSILSRRRFAFIVCTILLFYLSYEKFGLNFYVLFFEYSIIIILFFLFYNKKISSKLVNILYGLIKLISFWVFICLFDSYPSDRILYISLMFIGALFIFAFVFEKCDKMSRLFFSLSDIEENKQIKQTLFKISHEIKNPLAVCKGYLDMYDSNNSVHTTKYVPIIKSEIEKTLILLQDFLCLTKTNLKLEILDINMLIEDCFDNISLLLETNKIDLSMDLYDDDLYIEGDYNRLHQVFVNIVKNAIEAMRESELKKIFVRTYIDNKNVYIEVEDTGCGIDKDILDNIMQPFYTTKIDGTGLGVPLSVEIINAHNGEFKFMVGKCNGTTVYIRLPRA